MLPFCKIIFSHLEMIKLFLIGIQHPISSVSAHLLPPVSPPSYQQHLPPPTHTQDTVTSVGLVSRFMRNNLWLAATRLINHSNLIPLSQYKINLTLYHMALCVFMYVYVNACVNSLISCRIQI